HRTLFQAKFDRFALLQTLEFLASQGYDAVLYGDTYDEGFDFWCPRRMPPQAELREFLDLNAGYERGHAEMMTRRPEGIFAGFAMGTREQMLRLQADLERLLPDDLALHVLRSPRYTGFMCELGVAGISKWSGIRQLAEQWGIADDEICAVGDDVN